MVNNLMTRLRLVDEHLQTRTFFLGHRITLADISFVTALVPLFRYYFTAQLSKRMLSVFRIVKFCVNLPRFKQVIGRVWFCEESLQPVF